MKNLCVYLCGKVEKNNFKKNLLSKKSFILGIFQHFYLTQILFSYKISMLFSYFVKEVPNYEDDISA